LRRQQILLFISLFTLSIIPVLLHVDANLILTRYLSSILLFPVRITSNLIEYSRIFNTRVEDLEILVNKLKLQNARLRDIVNLDTTQIVAEDIQLLKASVIGRDPLNINGYLHIDKGTSHGVHKNQPVVSVNGLIGKIIDVAITSSIVETIENGGFTVSAVDVNTGIHGIVKTKTNLYFDYVRHGDAINVGDSILTSGMSELFPKGILIGTVQKVTESDDFFFKNVYIAPATQVNRLVSVYIVVGGFKAGKGIRP
jgi:rod shape-determining protein MreC